MKTMLVPLLAIASLAAAVSFLSLERPPAQPSVRTESEGAKLLARLPAAFVPNVGQWEHAARYVAQFGAMTVFLEGNGWVVTLADEEQGAAVRMQFANSDSDARIEPEVQLAGVHNYFLGSDPELWRSDVPRYASVRYESLYPGIDLRLRESNGVPEYDLLLQPGADLSQVVVRVEGGRGLSIASDGALVVDTAVGPLIQSVPKTWQTGADGRTREVLCHFTLLGVDRYGFEAAGWDGDTSLTIDPGLNWSTFLGGSVRDEAFAVAADARGLVTVAGITSSSNFPTTPGAYDTRYRGGGWDAFVCRLDPSLPAAKQLVYSTFLGGGSYDTPGGVAVDASGVVTVAGKTGSGDFPTTPGAYDRTHNGSRDVFVSRLDPSLPAAQQLVYSTLLGGSRNDQLYACSVDANGVVTVGGDTPSTDFPTTPGAYDTTFNGSWDGFVSRLDPSLPAAQQLVYSTYLGGSGWDVATAVSADASGVVTVAGRTPSANFPTTPGVHDTTLSGRLDGFVSRLDPSLPAAKQLVYSTFLGGSSSDEVLALSANASGVVTVAGSAGRSFPTTSGAYDTTYNSGYDGFVSRLDPSLPAAQQLVYSTFLGGSGRDIAEALSVDASGVVTVAGETASFDLPTTSGASDPTFNGDRDVFVSRLDPGRIGSAQLIYSTFLGGSGRDNPCGQLSVDARDAVTVAGATWSTNFPTTTGAYDSTYNGGSHDVFVTRLDMLPTGVSAYGRSSPGCTGPLAISVSSTPRIGDVNFALTCGNAPPSATGGLALGERGLNTPLVVLGAGIWVGPRGPWFVVVPTHSNSVGAATSALPLPNNPWLVGQRLNAQLVWIGPTSPPPCPPHGVSASNALAITLQR